MSESETPDLPAESLKSKFRAAAVEDQQSALYRVEREYLEAMEALAAARAAREKAEDERDKLAGDLLWLTAIGTDEFPKEDGRELTTEERLEYLRAQRRTERERAEKAEERVKVLREALRQVKQQVHNCDAPCGRYCEEYVDRALAADAEKEKADGR